MAMVFYDMTTIRAAGLSEQEGDLRQYGMAKEGIVARQVMLGVVQTAECLPLWHEVFDGNTAEVTTIKGSSKKSSPASPYAGRAGIDEPSSRGRDSYTNSRRLFEFDGDTARLTDRMVPLAELVGVAPSRRLTLNV